MLRSGRSRSTSTSNGTSWLASASRTTSRDRRSSSANVGSPETSVRSTSEFTKNPISGSSSTRFRLAIGSPIDDVVLAGVAVQQGVERREQGDEQRDVAARG